jgi:hypothetical protein
MSEIDMDVEDKTDGELALATSVPAEDSVTSDRSDSLFAILMARFLGRIGRLSGESISTNSADQRQAHAPGIVSCSG